ncbi:MAG TPA: SGNH/GDSL hydrolase family protein [Candidatus Binatus sp.]|nr:SGNH/GDSL hydrolase family protein [Candidatus Binatus sp.]
MRSRPGFLARSLLFSAAGLVLLAAAEIALRLAGLGHPILYDNRIAYGYRPLPDQTRRRLFGARVHVNHLGLRGPDPSPGALRLLFLGDSVTWGGSYVDDGDLFAAVAADTVGRRLAGRFPAVVALDAGVNGWGPQNILGLIDAHGGFESPVWVLTLLDDDLRRDKTRIAEVPYFNAPPSTALEEVLVLGAYELLVAYKRVKPDADVERLVAANLAACRAILDAARAAGARVLLVWHPSAPALGGEPELYRTRVLAEASAAGVPVLELAGAYRGREGLYVDAIHLSVAGHRVAGDAIGTRLADMLGVDGAD